jgi:hypothetical protein
MIMAGPLDTGQLSLIYLFFLPTLFSWLFSELNHATAALLGVHRLWHSVRLRVYCHPFKHRKKKSIGRPPPKFIKPQEMARTYLIMAIAMSLFKFGCRIESFLANKFRLSGPIRNPAPGPMCHRIAFQAHSDANSSTPSAVRFDTDSFKIGIDNHCSVTMVKSKDYFEDLVLDEQGKRVDGIEGGLEILGRGTF